MMIPFWFECGRLAFAAVVFGNIGSGAARWRHLGGKWTARYPRNIQRGNWTVQKEKNGDDDRTFLDQIMYTRECLQLVSISSRYLLPAPARGRCKAFVVSTCVPRLALVRGAVYVAKPCARSEAKRRAALMAVWAWLDRLSLAFALSYSPVLQSRSNPSLLPALLGLHRMLLKRHTIRHLPVPLTRDLGKLRFSRLLHLGVTPRARVRPGKLCAVGVGHGRVVCVCCSSKLKSADYTLRDCCDTSAEEQQMCQPSVAVEELLKARRKSPLGSKPMMSLEAPRRWKKSCSLASCCCPARSSIGVAGMLASVEGVAGGVGSGWFGVTVRTLWGIGMEREGVPSAAAAPEACASVVLVGSITNMSVESPRHVALLCNIPSSTSICSLAGFGCAISACSFAFRRSLRAFSAGEKTFFRSALLFFFTRLARSPLAIAASALPISLVANMCGGRVVVVVAGNFSGMAARERASEGRDRRQQLWCDLAGTRELEPSRTRGMPLAESAVGGSVHAKGQMLRPPGSLCPLRTKTIMEPLERCCAAARD